MLNLSKNRYNLVPTLDQARSLCEREVLRARRMNLRLTVIHLRVASKPGGYFAPQPLRVETVLKRCLRSLDIAGRMENGGYMLLLPDTARREALNAMRRLREMGQREGLVLEYELAEFPADALTLQDLVAAVTRTPAVAPKKTPQGEPVENYGY